MDLLRKNFGSVDHLHFAIHCNEAGQTLLIPETPMPLHETWLYRNPAALKSVLTGIEQAQRGDLGPPRSFAQYADDTIE